MRRFRLLALTIIITTASSFTALAGQWIKDNKGWWYKYNKGWWPAAKWQEIDGKWYYFYADGYMAYNTWIGDYYVSASGAMLTNTTTPDGYRVGADGAWVRPAYNMSLSNLPISKEPFDGYKVVVDKKALKFYRPGRSEIKSIAPSDIGYSESPEELMRFGFIEG